MREELLKEYAEEALKNGPHRFIRPDDKVFYVDGFKDGYKLGLDAKINKTTISDAPALPEADEDYKISIAKEAWDAVNICTPYHPESFVQGYIAGAGVKRDQIKTLGDRCNQLLKDKGRLTDKVRELEEKLANADYQLEGRDLEIKELEKENADLKEEINKIAFARGNLEEENAELKGLKDVATLIRANNDTVTTLMQLNNMLVSRNQQLTKAKEIIKGLLELGSIGDGDYTYVAQAEQFLKE